MRFVLLLVGCVLLAWPACAQGIDTAIRRDADIEDYDFSWVYWFETRGQVYVRESVAGRKLPWDTPASRRWRPGAVEALTKLLADDDDQVRAAAVLSLARLGEKSLLDKLLLGGDSPDTGLLLDESAHVRRSAWAALGLLDVPRSRAALSIDPLDDATEADRAAQAMAIGLLKKLDKAQQKWLVDRLGDREESLEVKRWCLWAMREHDDKALDPAVKAALATLPSTFVIGEVMLDRAWVSRNGGAELLVDMLRYHPDMRAWPGYRALEGMPEGGVYASTPRRLAMETRIAATLTLAELPKLEFGSDRARMFGVLRGRMVAGNSAQAMDFNRGFDTLTYFMHSQADQDDLDLLYNQLRGLTQLALDDPAVTEGLAEGESAKPEDLIQRQSDNAVRGYAALTAGLLIRRATEGTTLFKTRPIEGRRDIEIERLKRRFGLRLMRAVADRREPTGYRAACALALGLTGDKRYSAELIAELGKLRGGDEAVLGYGLLSLAMLGEQRAAEPAQRYVTRPGVMRGIDDYLGRRAALRALGVIGLAGGDDVRKGLGGAWGRDPWVSLAVAQASAWAGRYDAVGKMMEATKSENANWRRAAALSLGMVFENAYPSRLTRLTETINPVMSFAPRLGDQAVKAPLLPGLREAPNEIAEAQPVTGWPIIQLHALGDRFVFEKMRVQPKAEPKPDDEDDDDEVE